MHAVQAGDAFFVRLLQRDVARDGRQVLDRSGARAVRVLPPVPSGSWAGRLEELKLEAADRENVLAAAFGAGLPVLDRTGMVNCELPSAYKIFILPDGALAPCEHLPYVFAGSGAASVKDTLARMKDLPLFKEKHGCWPRSREFREKHFPPGGPRDLIKI